MKTFLVFYMIGVVGFANCDTSSSEWSYKYENGWPNQCRKAGQQSPINIMSRSAIVDTFQIHIRGPLVFRGYGDVKLRGVNTGRTLKWKFEEDTGAPVLSGGPLRGNYTFVQFHLHWFSEHAIDGIKYPMEIHMLHIKTGLTIEEALKLPDGLAVIAVLCQVHADENSEYSLQEIEPLLPTLYNKTSGPGFISTLNLSRLLSPQPQSFYTYHGSLTTPDCQEVVTWIVMDHPISISDYQYKMIRQVDVGGVDNYRSLQPTNRVVYKSAASSISSPLPIGLLGVLLNMSSLLKSTLGTGACVVINLKRKFFADKKNYCTNAAA
ncbi:unnamed protein product [Parnassius apollo]|uniref:Carbonic anhydrase n=1 Tax=Parnassius apollo TaxID=110799 RepID=A0A8S3XNU7_PARAO|nr:unnamed protein product [Parnassius apollo]